VQKRAYATISHGQIHYRHQGTGIPLILLHQSPRSSSEYQDLIDRWSRDFYVIAPDTPGNGLSDPLPKGTPTMFDYSDALIEFMDVLKVRQALLYGFHTGASIAVAAAARYPHRILHAVANGLALLEEEQRRDFLANYLPEINPKADGSHLDWLWHRIKDQAKYFPWYSRRKADRLTIPAYSPAKCQDILVDFLLAGDNYRGPYRAAFAFEPVSAGLLPAANVTVCATEGDPLSASLSKLPAGQDRFSAASLAECEQKALTIFTEKGR